MKSREIIIVYGLFVGYDAIYLKKYLLIMNNIYNEGNCIRENYILQDIGIPK